MSLLAVLGIGSSLVATPPAPAIQYAKFKSGKAWYHTVTARVSPDSYSVETVESHRLTSIRNLIAKPQPVAAITGTFFCPRAQRPIADVVVDGSLVAHGAIGSAFGVDWYGVPRIFDTRYGSVLDWGAYRFGLRGAIRVVSGGVVRPNPKAQRFYDPHLRGRAARTGLGLTADGRVVMIATKGKVTLSEFGRAMRVKGVTEGINLDGGSSTCLYYQGSFVLSTSRRLSNLVVLRKAGDVAISARVESTQGATIQAPVAPLTLSARKK